MSDLLSYDITDFLAFNLEVYQSLFSQLNELIWPLQIFLVVANYLLLFKLKPFYWVQWVYLSCLWGLNAWFFHYEIYGQVLWAAHYIALVWAVQAVLIIVVMFCFLRTDLSTNTKVTDFGKNLFIFSVGVPFSYILPWSSGQVLLFGWGPDQLALGSIGLALMLPSTFLRIGLSLIPASWLLFEILTYVAIELKF